MQEDIEHRSVAITIQAGKLTGRVLKSAIAAALRRMKQMEQSRDNPKVGRNSLERLAGQDGGSNTIEVGGRIQSFERIARKYGIRYHIKKEPGVTPPKWTVYFKSNQADALTAAFAEYTRKDMARSGKPSLLAQLRKNVELVKNAVVDLVKKKEHGGPEL